MGYQENEVLAKLPEHLKQFINDQDYDAYTPINQATWRYVMRKNVDYLSRVAHESYLEGLRKTGISIEEIPTMCLGMRPRFQRNPVTGALTDG